MYGMQAIDPEKDPNPFLSRDPARQLWVFPPVYRFFMELSEEDNSRYSGDSENTSSIRAETDYPWLAGYLRLVSGAEHVLPYVLLLSVWNVLKRTAEIV
ncbi:hypothetical protein BOTNAR_0018g00250 [Botryotinia narcissicola]|uniref:Uncharacterized protein n=1 Tax=Botryotinia narcissicola TaxID=278944 RepID=A0A4Z1JBU0_9HELO|nr:hypothetical protein BOTNAR_0018g00250 [Botryotinia narcissicola]